MAMDFKAAGARVRSLIAAKKPQQLPTSALQRDVLRDNVVDEAIQQSPRFQAAANQTPRVEWDREQEDGTTTRESFEWSSFGDALTDVARAGYQWDEPDVRRPDQVRPSHRFNREVISRMIRSEGFQESRPYTRDNSPEALFGAQNASYEMIERAPEVAEHIARAEQMAEQEQDIADAEDMLEQLRDRAREQHNELPGVDPDLVEQIKGQIAKRQGARGQLQQLIDAHNASGAGKAAQKVAAAAAQAYQEGVEAAHALRQIPGCEPGSPHNRTPGAQLALAEKLIAFPDLLEVLKTVGRLVNDMRFKRQARTRNVKVEPVGVTTGNDPPHLLPHELARMGITQLQPLWALDWANRSLLQWEMGGKEPAGKGPGIVVYDGSGSMDGVKINWTHALAVAILTLMRREGLRDFAAIEFGWRSELKSWFFPGRDAPDPDEVIDMATHFYGGGTDITIGLREAKRIIESVPAFKMADVILISDGQDRFEAEDAKIVDELKKLDVRIHGISILCPGNAFLAQACEYVVDVEELFGSNNATDALAENIT